MIATAWWWKSNWVMSSQPQHACPSEHTPLQRQAISRQRIACQCAHSGHSQARNHVQLMRVRDKVFDNR
jgi:hypothetical protein